MHVIIATLIGALLLTLPAPSQAGPAHVDRWDGEQLLVAGDTVNGDRAVVHTKVLLRNGTQVPVDLAVVRCADARWRVWDVRAMGSSLVSSYRAQFARMLQATPYDQMLDKLRAKVDSLEP